MYGCRRFIGETWNCLGRPVPEIHCQNLHLLAVRAIGCARSPALCFVAVSGSFVSTWYRRVAEVWNRGKGTAIRFTLASLAYDY